MKKLFILTLFLFNILNTYAQIVFQINNSTIIDVKHDSNGNSTQIGYDGLNSFILKMNSQNNIIWSKSIGLNHQIDHQLIIGNDIYVLSRDTSDYQKKYLTKLNENGIFQWARTILTNDNYDGIIVNQPISINSSENIGVLFTTQNSLLIFVISQNGNAIWSKEIPLPGSILNGNKIVATSDNLGNIYISYTSLNNNSFLIKLDSVGNLIFHNEYIDAVNFSYHSKLIINQNELILLSAYGFMYPALYKLNLNGDFTDAFYIPQLSYSTPRDLLLYNQKIYFVGETNNFSTAMSLEPFIMEIDTNYNINKYVSSLYADEAFNFSIYQNEFLVTTNGFTSKFDQNLKYACDTFMRNIISEPLSPPVYAQSYNQINSAPSMSTVTLPLSNFVVSSTIICQTNGFNNNDFDCTINIFPNPASGQFFLSFDSFEKSNNYVVLDISGKEIISGKIISTQTKIDCSNWSKGIYLVKVGNEKGYKVEKIVVE